MWPAEEVAGAKSFANGSVPPPSGIAGKAGEHIVTYRLSKSGNVVSRTVLRRNGMRHISQFKVVAAEETEPNTAADLAFIRAQSRPREAAGKLIRSVDLFCGCGAMSLGIWEACRAIGERLDVRLAADVEFNAVATYKANFPNANVVACDVGTLLDGGLGERLSPTERTLAAGLGRIDIACAGPPCQGNSDLNNWTRRNDPKNNLYSKMGRFAEVVMPRHLIVENVPAVRHDKSRVVERTMGRLSEIGYAVVADVVEVGSLGLAQGRKRHVLIASLEHRVDLRTDLEQFIVGARPVRWAIGDLVTVAPDGALGSPTKVTPRMQERLEYLFERGLYDLPDEQRPDCHRLKNHSYKAVYGRMRWDKPAPTITGGFTCMGQGRFVHPVVKRTITPHEAARLQFIPDFFRFPEGIPRTHLAQLIGNAVPPKLTYVLGLLLLR